MIGGGSRGEGAALLLRLARPATLGGIHQTSRHYFGVSVDRGLWPPTGRPHHMCNNANHTHTHLYYWRKQQIMLITQYNTDPCRTCPEQGSGVHCVIDIKCKIDIIMNITQAVCVIILGVFIFGINNLIDVNCAICKIV